MPILLIIYNIFTPITDIGVHIFNIFFKDIMVNTFILLLFVLIFTYIIGFTIAYLEVMYEYRYKRYFSIMSIIPFAIPNYIYAYIYQDIDYRVSGMFGAIFVLSLAFYPYIYLIIKGYLKNMDMDIIETSYSLGYGKIKTLFKVILPMTRPASIGAITIAAMEVLNVYGVVHYFGLYTFSTSIYNAWIDYKDIDTAIKLSAILLLIIYIILIFENIFRGKKRYSSPNARYRKIKKEKLKGIKEMLVLAFLTMLNIFAVFIPLYKLIRYTIWTYNDINYGNILNFTINTLKLASIATIIILIISLYISYKDRYRKYNILSKLTIMGYSVSGSIIAIGSLVLFISLDKYLYPLYNHFNIDKTLFLTLSPSILIFAYIVRFLKLGYTSIYSGFNKIGLKYNEASKSLGQSTIKTLFRVDIPMIRSSIISACIIVFVEITKELAMTMLLSGFNYRVLSGYIDELVSNEMLEYIGVPSLILITISSTLLIFLNKYGKERDELFRDREY